MQVSAVLALVAALAVATSAQSYCQLCRDHTMCKYQGRGQACGRYIKGGVSQNDANTIVSVHNTLRQRVARGQERRGSNGPQPAATDMQKMEWDKELAAVAQRWADQCQDNHDRCRKVARYGVGQNIHWTFSSEDSARPNWKSAVNGWYDEVAKFSRNDVHPFRFSASTAHYSQVVWASTNKVGCGFSYYKKNGGQWYTGAYVCNYGPAGNVPGGKMYNARRTNG